MHSKGTEGKPLAHGYGDAIHSSAEAPCFRPRDSGGAMQRRLLLYVLATALAVSAPSVFARGGGGTRSHSSSHSGAHSSGHTGSHSSSHAGSHSSSGKHERGPAATKPSNTAGHSSRSERGRDSGHASSGQRGKQGAGSSAHAGNAHAGVQRAGGVKRHANGKIHRSSKAKAEFQKSHPCPSTGRKGGACPGYVVDHVTPLKRGGWDSPLNMQWQTKAAAKAKDKVE